MDTRDIQKHIYQNKVDKGFNVTNIEKEPCFLHGEMAELYEDIHECFDSAGFQRLLQSAIKRRTSCKEKCEIFDFCAGGCNSVALVGGNLEEGNEYICGIRRQIYNYIAKKVVPLRTLKMEELKKKINPHMIKYLA